MVRSLILLVGLIGAFVCVVDASLENQIHKTSFRTSPNANVKWDPVPEVLQAAKAEAERPKAVNLKNMPENRHHHKEGRLGTKTRHNREQRPSPPYWSGAFQYENDGSSWSYRMLGGNPAQGRTTRLKTVIQPISLFFSNFGFFPITESTIQEFVNSPLYTDYPFATGNTQLVDAFQRANFWNVEGAEDWHTRFDPPVVRPAITVFGDDILNVILTCSGGAAFIGDLDETFWLTQLVTLFQTIPTKNDEILVFLTSDIVLYEGSDPILDCCVLGFHGSIQPATFSFANYVDKPDYDKPFLWASYLSQAVASNCFAPYLANTFIAAHEYLELVNDPFPGLFVEDPKVNLVQNTPLLGVAECESVLEICDITENLANGFTALPADGIIYNVPNCALVSYFARESPSTSFQGYYTFPTNVVTSLPAAC